MYKNSCTSLLPSAQPYGFVSNPSSHNVSCCAVAQIMLFFVVVSEFVPSETVNATLY